MAQVTVDMCDHIIVAADKRERFPLTANELRQLAHLARGVLASAIETSPLILPVDENGNPVMPGGVRKVQRP